MNHPLREIRADFDTESLVVYQAYNPEIAAAAVRAGRFGAGFKVERMTWIKPSFLWMMYRSGWATKPGQDRVLAIRITRAGFEWALRHSALSHYEPGMHACEQEWRDGLVALVRVQWDPERDLRSAPLPYRSLQVGLAGDAVRRYLDEWIVAVTDITDTVRTIREATNAAELLPVERSYPVPDDIAAALGMRSVA
ncbi:DUF4291 domain-containing protein [Nocardia asteroides]|uniref:DUF4291 domain-containing protein n=1 Tax=Nocardia asteroides TaxID=1824 RepID=UPI001E3C1077|nr:DUF4291 domain-containing protein [Nocardia asteroides]UGT62300.1 DUF4291 domain-containing protein [Nocardia asteroides]